MGSVLEDRAWMAGVRDPSGRIVGSGFAIDGERVLTCAHVVDAAGAAGPGDSVVVEFPSLSLTCHAVVLHEGWSPGDGTVGDVAVLRLVDAPAAIRPAPVRALYSLDELAFTAYGFPAGYDEGLSTRGRIGVRVGRQWVQLESDSHAAIERGYSGGAVWSSRHAAVVAMMVTRDTATAGKIAFAVPISTLTELFSPLDLDPATATHWGPRSRGVNSDVDVGGWTFTGRRRILDELAAWLASRDGPPLRVVTGVPGAGKSAILARLVTTADRHYRTRIPQLDGGDPAVPAEGAIDVTMHVRGRTVREFVEHVAGARCLSVSDSTPGALAEAINDAGRVTIVIDALDEAAEPAVLCRALIDLAGRGARILAGCRTHLLRHLVGADVLYVDRSPYRDDADVEGYVTRLLGACAPSLVHDTHAIAREISLAATGNFLVAQLHARTVLLGATAAHPHGTDVGFAFDRLLEALPDPATTRELLAPLALSAGRGLPRDLWLQAASAIGHPYHPGDIEALLAGPAASLVTRVEVAGGERFALFHQALADTLTIGRDVTANQTQIWRAWAAAAGLGRPGCWDRGPAYLLEHGAAHANAAGALGELAGDAAYVIHADLDRLMLELGGSTHVAVETLAVLRLAANRARRLAPGERGVLLALTARHLGLNNFAEAALACSQPAWRPRWAHGLGKPHHLLSGHTGRVFSVAIGRVGERDLIVSSGSDGVRVWDAISGEPIGVQLTSELVARTVLGQIEGRPVIVAAAESAVGVWDAASGEQLLELPRHYDRLVDALALGRVDGHDIIVTGTKVEHTVHLWDGANGRLIRTHQHSGYVAAVAIARVGGRDIVAVGGEGGVVRIWHPTTGQELCAPLGKHAGWVNAIAIGRGGERDLIATGSNDATVGVWELATADAPPGLLVASGGIYGSPDDVGWGADAHGAGFKVRHPSPPDPRGGLFGHDTAAIGRAGSMDVIACADQYGTVRVWNAVTRQPVGEPLHGHTGSVWDLAIGRAGDRSIIASASDDGTVRVWDASFDQARASSLPGHVQAVDALASGRIGDRDIVASTAEDGMVAVWNAADGRLASEPTTGHTALVVGRAGRHEVIVSPGRGATVGVWDAASRQPLYEPLSGHPTIVYELPPFLTRGTGMFPDAEVPAELAVHNRDLTASPFSGTRAVAIGRLGKRDVILTAGTDWMVRIWDAARRRRVGTLVGHVGTVDAVAIGRADARDIIASGGSDTTVRIWDGDSYLPLGWALRGHSDPVTTIAIGNAGAQTILASGDEGGHVWLWDAAAGLPLGEPLTDHAGRVEAVAIGRAGEVDFIASAGADATVRLYDATTRASLQVIHTLAAVASVAIDGSGAVCLATGPAVAFFEPGAWARNLDQRPVAEHERPPNWWRRMRPATPG